MGVFMSHNLWLNLANKTVQIVQRVKWFKCKIHFEFILFFELLNILTFKPS